MKSLPLSFDWRTAMQHNSKKSMTSPFDAITSLNEGDAKGSGNLVQQIMQHINDHVKKTDKATYAKYCNPEAFVLNEFVNPVLMPNIFNHRIDADGLIYLSQQLKNDHDAYEGGILENADGTVYISSGIILKQIVSHCL